MPDYDVVLPVNWWARDLGRARGLFEVFGQRPASLADVLCMEARFDPFPGLIWLSVNLADAPTRLLLVGGAEDMTLCSYDFNSLGAAVSGSVADWRQGAVRWTCILVMRESGFV